jgi:beta-xylosidase
VKQVSRNFAAFARLAMVVGLAIPMAGAAGDSGILPKPPELSHAWGDQGDGTYVNPVIPGDYSDLDAIRVGDDFYAISSTFQFSPGVVILHSKDLVSWSIIGHAVDDLTRISPELNWDRMNRYGHGVWAGAIRFHNNRFWIYFGTPDEGFFVTTATKPEGPWEPVRALWKVQGWDDCCPFWDDDGKGYFVCTNFSGGYKIHLFKLSEDGLSLLSDSDTVIHQSRGSEANKLYKINGIYYHYYSEVHPEGRVAMMERSRNLSGPWESRQLNHVSKNIDKEPNQGGLIQLASGDWWFVTHQGTGDWEGRAMVLLPVTWIDGWPIIGQVGADGIGTMVWSAKKPMVGLSSFTPQTSDDFSRTTLSPQWEWNYQPRADKWSLAERPGFLRLHAFRPLKADDLLKAGNTLTQRALRTNSNSVSVKIDLSNMANGEVAGLCHFAKGYSTFGVVQAGSDRELCISEKGKLTKGPAITAASIWLQTQWDLGGDSHYSYSLDGIRYQDFGDPYRLTWGSYRGDRIGLFTYNNTADEGYVDFSQFIYQFAQPLL